MYRRTKHVDAGAAIGAVGLSRLLLVGAASWLYYFIAPPERLPTGVFLSRGPTLFEFKDARIHC